MKESKEVILQSEGTKPDNFDELPVATVEKEEVVHKHCDSGCCGSHDHHDSGYTEVSESCSCEPTHDESHEHSDGCGCGHEHKHEKAPKWETMRYAVIDWDDMNVRRMFFTLLTQTFDRWGRIRGEKLVYAGTESFLEEVKKKNPNFLDKANPKISITRMVFNNKKRGVKFSFDMTDLMPFTIINGTQRNIFRLFLQQFDKPFRTIAEEHMEAHQKIEEEKNKGINPPEAEQLEQAEKELEEHLAVSNVDVIEQEYTDNEKELLAEITDSEMIEHEIEMSDNFVEDSEEL